MTNDRRCKKCGDPLMRNTGESVAYFEARMFCNRSCYAGWNNAKPIWQTLAEKTEEQATGCIEWQGHRDAKGYGRFCTASGEVLVHRIAFRLHYGAIPEGAHILHRCDNPSCCNPQHLFAGSNQDNMDDRVRKGRQARLFGKQNPNWKHGRNCKASPKAHEIRLARQGRER